MKSQAYRAALQKRVLNKKVALGQVLHCGLHIAETRLLFAAGPITSFTTLARHDLMMALEVLSADEREIVAKYLSRGLGFFVSNNAADMFNVVAASAQQATPAAPWTSATAVKVVVTELMLNAIMAGLASETQDAESYLPDRTFGEGEDCEQDNPEHIEVLPVEKAIMSGYVYTVRLQSNMKQTLSTWDDTPVMGSTVRVNVRTGETSASSIIH